MNTLKFSYIKKYLSLMSNPFNGMLKLCTNYPSFEWIAVSVEKKITF